MEGPNNSSTPSQAGLLLRMGLNDNKAGMQGLDKEKINKVIMEASKVCLLAFSNALAIQGYWLHSIKSAGYSLGKQQQQTCVAELFNTELKVC